VCLTLTDIAKIFSSWPPDVQLTPSYSLNAMTYFIHTGIDYLVNRENPSSRTFTVTFQSNQANSTENDMEIAADSIVEGTETFRLRIVAARFIGGAASTFRAQDGLNNTVAEVTIEDDDCKFTIISIICLKTVTGRTSKYMHVMHALLLL